MVQLTTTVPALVVKPRHHTCTCYNCWIQTSLPTPTCGVWIMPSCGNHIQPSGFALVLYEVTALVHYTPYTTGRGGLTITYSHSYYYPVRMCKGKVISSVVVVVVSTNIARSTILGELVSANCSQGVINRKKTREHASRLSKRDHKSYINRSSCWSRLLVTPTAIICICMRHILIACTRARTLAIDQY